MVLPCARLRSGRVHRCGDPWHRSCRLLVPRPVLEGCLALEPENLMMMMIMITMMMIMMMMMMMIPDLKPVMKRPLSVPSMNMRSSPLVLGTLTSMIVLVVRLHTFMNTVSPFVS